MSDFVLAEGFGNLSNGTHTAGTTREILGEQWSSYALNFAIEDIADGRKWIIWDGTLREINLRAPLPSLTSLRFAFRIIRPTGADVHHAFNFYNAAAGSVCYLRIGTDGKVNFAGTTIAASSTGTIPVDTETHVEVVVSAFSTSADATVTFYLNGVESGVVNNVRTANNAGPLASLGFCTGGGNASRLASGWKYTDFIVHTGSSPLGDTGVFFIEPDADGTDDDFTPSAGADNFAMVDEIGPDEDTTYNESDGTAGHRDSFATAGISGVTVLSVGTLVRARKTDTGAATLLLGAVHGASEDQGSAVGLSEDYLTYVEFFDDVPGGAGWTPAQVSAAELSYEVGA